MVLVFYFVICSLSVVFCDKLHKIYKLNSNGSLHYCFVLDICYTKYGRGYFFNGDSFLHRVSFLFLFSFSFTLRFTISFVILVDYYLFLHFGIVK